MRFNYHQLCVNLKLKYRKVYNQNYVMFQKEFSSHKKKFFVCSPRSSCSEEGYKDYSLYESPWSHESSACPYSLTD